MTDGLPQNWSRAEFAAGLHISPKAIDRLVREGRASFYMAGRSKRFLAEHVAQIVAALEVRAAPPEPSAISQVGLSTQSAARRRRVITTRPGE